MKKIAPFQLAFALLFSGYEMFHSKSAKDKKAAADKPAKPGRLRQAVKTHDLTTLASMMTENFGYSLNPERSGDSVFKFWDLHNLWPDLQGIMTERCLQKGEYWVAPPQFADESLHYDGYRAGIRRVNASWKFTYFVNG
ncbi:MAG: hypothetical protein ABJB09_04570 [Verrucomicrobiota bacterium]